MKKLLKVVACAAALSLPLVVIAAPAGATPPTGYGFDNHPHVIVGGGSDTTYIAMVGITDLYMRSDGCQVTTALGPNINQCLVTGSPDISKLGNQERDTVAQANQVGSSTGIGSLNGFIPNGQTNTTYGGTVNPVPAYLGSTATGPNVDFARSSRPPKTTGGNAIGGNELGVDTFWGFGQDGIEMYAFNNRAAQIQGKGGLALTPNEIFHIFNCDFTQWSQVPSLGIAPNSATDGPIVPWGVNAASGTFATFQTYMQNFGGTPAGWSPDAQACDRHLANGTFPLENDVKIPLNDPAALSSNPTSTDNPENWISWGSFGVLNANSYDNAFTRSGTLYASGDLPVNGTRPNSANILANTYPIGRTVYHVTRNQDADCPQTVPGTCDFGIAGPLIPANGQTDLNVTGATGGIGGAVREFTRFVCRKNAAQHGIDPYTGNNYFGEITTAINTGGFTLVPSALRSANSRCLVVT